MQAGSQNLKSNGLYQRLTLSHGYLNKKGYCNGNDCQVLPPEGATHGSYTKSHNYLQVSVNKACSDWGSPDAAPEQAVILLDSKL